MKILLKFVLVFFFFPNMKGIRIWFIQDENMFKTLIVLKTLRQKPSRILFKTNISW